MLSRAGTGINWVIVGGESGNGARPMHPAWPRSLRDQCAAAGVPFLFKQWGEWLPAKKEGDSLTLVIPANVPCTRHPEWAHIDETTALAKVGKTAAGRTLDGITHDGYPKVDL
jgi:hypothetical protein